MIEAIPSTGEDLLNGQRLARYRAIRHTAPNYLARPSRTTLPSGYPQRLRVRGVVTIGSTTVDRDVWLNLATQRLDDRFELDKGCLELFHDFTRDEFRVEQAVRIIERWVL